MPAPLRTRAHGRRSADLLLLPEFVDIGGGDGAVVLLVVGESKAEAEEGGRPFADEDAPPVSAGEAGAGFGFEAADPGGDGEAGAAGKQVRKRLSGWPRCTR